jgi:DNA cross-link repair 1A protein
MVTEDLNMSSYLHVSLKEEDVSLTESQIKPEIEPECMSDQIQIDSGKAEEQLNMLLYNKNSSPEKDQWNLEENLIPVESQLSDEDNFLKHDLNEIESKEDSTEHKESLNTGNKKKKVVVPKYKIVQGSQFAVDAFRYGEISNVTHYFLTHYHADHYIGLTKKFANPIYLSKITGTFYKLT